MVLFSFRKIAFACCLLGLMTGPRANLRAEAALSAAEVIGKALTRAQHTQAGAGKPDYTYTKVSVTEELDATGKVKEHKEKVYQVLFRAGMTHVKLLEVNGHPPGEGELRKQSDNDSTVRQLLGQSKSGGGDNRENFLTPELVARFDFEVVGQDVISGRTAYRIAFQPKNPEAPVHHMVDKLLNRISGVLWIDAEEFEVARAEIQLGSEVDLLGGLVGRLKRLVYTMIRTRITDGLWLNSFTSGDFEGRKLLDSMRIKTKSQSSNFRPLAMDS